MYRINVSGLDKMIKGAENFDNTAQVLLRRAMQQSLTVVTNEAKKNAPYRSGRLRRSIFPTFHSIMRGEVSASTPYAQYVELGTKPHTITPKKAKALAFKVGGKMVFTKKVNHPGFKGRFYMRRTAQRTVKRVADIYEKVTQQLVKVVFNQ